MLPAQAIFLSHGRILRRTTTLAFQVFVIAVFTQFLFSTSQPGDVALPVTIVHAVDILQQMPAIVLYSPIAGDLHEVPVLNFNTNFLCKSCTK